MQIRTLYYILIVILFVASINVAFFDFGLVTTLMGKDIDELYIEVSGKNVSAKILYLILLSLSSFVYFLFRKVGNVRENRAYAIFYGFIASLLVLLLA